MLSQVMLYISKDSIMQEHVVDSRSFITETAKKLNLNCIHFTENSNLNRLLKPYKLSF